jgi:light-regulated signal transduction histidine kinase (bacteriophytochrome)
MAASRDVTPRKQREHEIQRLNQMLREKAVALEAVNNELEAFSYSVSHDLRAPLRGIDGFSHALLEDCNDKLDDTGKDYLCRIRTATQRMGTMIDSLLSLSRLSRKDLNVTSVDLSGLANEAFEDLRKADPARNPDWSCAPGLRDTADQSLMRHVFQNLLGNAWKYTRDCPQARIEFGATDTDGRRTYFVRDNGAGFDTKYASKLFIAFQRLHSYDEFEGAGVGLATVKRIILRLGGSVWAEGQVGNGATFFFTLDDGAKE